MMKKTLRIATGSFCHETNSFSSVLVTKEFFAQRSFEKEEFFNQYGGVKNLLR